MFVSGRGLPFANSEGRETGLVPCLLLLKRYLAATQIHLPDPTRMAAKLKCLERLSAKADLPPLMVGHDHFTSLAGARYKCISVTA